MTGSSDELRELDARFARKVMGWKVVYPMYRDGRKEPHRDTPDNLVPLPKFHLSLDAVEPGIEKVGVEGFEINSRETGGFDAFLEIPHWDHYPGGHGQTRAEALMRALLSAKEGK